MFSLIIIIIFTNDAIFSLYFRSDVLGHIMPIVGNAWAQSGVAKLFNRIEDNGYKLLYLSARAIGKISPEMTN